MYRQIAADRIRAEIERLNAAIAAARGRGERERLPRLQARRTQLTDDLIAMEIEASAERWR